MRVLVMGAGGVGGYYGAALALSGHDVTFVARGQHLAAMRENGLELRSGGQVRRLKPVSAVASPGEAGGDFDLVLFTVKTYDTDAAAAALKPAVGPITAIPSLGAGCVTSSPAPQRPGELSGTPHGLRGRREPLLAAAWIVAIVLVFARSG